MVDKELMEFLGLLNFLMTGESGNRMIYIQRIGLFLLGAILLMGFFFVLQNTANAGSFPVAQSSPIPIAFTDYKVKSAVYAIKETPDIIPEFLEEIEPLYDIYTDTSFEKYVGPGVPFTDIEYMPEDLVPIESNFTANYSKKYQMREEAAKQFADMAWHFWKDFGGDKIWISSAYRTKSFQEYMLNHGCSVIRCAQPGTSEHQAGLAIDMKVISKYGTAYSLYSGSKYYQRFVDNAYKWGFHNTYQKGVEVDGYRSEGRHWRYMGTGLATELHEQGLTFAEYYKELIASEEEIQVDAQHNSIDYDREEFMINS